MNVLIIDNEVYLAQKVVSRLLDDGHNCDFEETHNIDKIICDYDVILMATSLPCNLRKDIIKKYSKKSIIILLASYTSDQTVTNHIKDGAKDYIMKPFIMDELIRKIYNYIEIKNTKIELETYKSYFNFTMSHVDTNKIQVPLKFPFLIETDSQKYSDKLVFEISNKINLPICFISLNSAAWQKEISSIKDKTIIYCINYHTLKKSMKDILIKSIENKICIISSLERENDFLHKKITINSNKEPLLNTNIMTINDYVKTIVTSYQNKYSDTELSKKLGISRKSLWEKRKKLEIEKKYKSKGNI